MAYTIIAKRKHLSLSNSIANGDKEESSTNTISRMHFIPIYTPILHPEIHKLHSLYVACKCLFKRHSNRVVTVSLNNLNLIIHDYPVGNIQ